MPPSLSPSHAWLAVTGQVLNFQLALDGEKQCVFQVERALGVSPDQTQIIYSLFEAIGNLQEATFRGILYNFIETASALYETQE